MDDGFSRALAEWTAFYALMGGAAATLLGLLFVAVSLRLNIFHQREVADVRGLATFTLGTFLVAIAVAGLALAPHEQRVSLAVPLFLAGVAGLAMAARIARIWLRLNKSAIETPSGAGYVWLGICLAVAMATPHIGLILVGWLLLIEHPAALGWLAVSEGALLMLGTAAAWLMLSHAGTKALGDTDGV